MKSLPETPSVDFLRQEAKDLLTAMRETEPDATLMRAQRALAERYGFRTWDELKAEVQRRRATVAVVAPELGGALASAFGLGRPAGAMTHLSWSQTGERWSLDTDEGRFMLRTILDYITPESLEGAARLREAAIAAGVRAPESLRTPNGDLIVSVAGKHWCADSWIDVGPEPTLPVSSRVAAKAGETLGILHSLALPASGSITPWLTARRSVAQWEEILVTVRNAGADWAPLLEDALPAIVDITSMCVNAPDDDVMLCICSFGPVEVRLAKGDELAVMHWDFSGPNAPNWELGGAFNQWAFSDQGSVNDVAIRAFMQGYRSRATSMPKLDPGIFTPAICGHLNWTAGRIDRALDGSDPERQRREVLELRGLLTRPRTRAIFEGILDAAS